MKMLTLWQPWASLVALGFKKYETRSWLASYRGSIIIHASKRPLNWKDLELWEEITDTDPHSFSFPMGCAIAVANLVNCQIMTNANSVPCYQISIDSVSTQEKLAGIWEIGRYAWKFENVRQIDPFYCRGFQGLIDAPNEVAIAVNPESQHEIAPSPLQLSLFDEHL